MDESLEVRRDGVASGSGEPSRPSALRESGSTRVWALSAALATGAAAAFLIGVRHLDPPTAPFEIPWWALAVVFFAVELCVVHVHVRRDAYSLTLGEIPLVLGLFFVSPAALVAARVLGAGAALALAPGTRQRPVKLVFNLSLFGVATCLGALVFHLVAGPGALLHPRGIVAAFVATVAIALLDALVIFLVMELSGGRLQPGKLLEAVAFATVVAVTNTSLALVSAAILWTAPEFGFLLLAPACALVFAYRAYMKARRKHASLEFLYETTRAIHRSTELDSALIGLLEQARSVFRADLAEIVLFSQRSETALRTTLGPGDRREVLRPADKEAAERAAALYGGAVLIARPRERRAFGAGQRDEPRDAMIAPIRTENRVLGTLLVTNRLGDLERFGADDVRLFETLANHAGVALELIELDEELRQQAFYDSLTGLPNRALFRDRVEHALAATRRKGSRPAVLFLDLDDFKTINDSLGHAAGDQLLVTVAERLRSGVRDADTAARLGGDEFGILVEDVRDTSEPALLAERLIASLQEPVTVEGKEITVTASAGISISAGGEQDAADLMRDGDAAMYRAKKAGKGRYEIFEPSMHAAALRRLELKADLQSAVERGQLVLLYQPIVELETTRINALEALIRWRHPVRGLVGPAEFIELAEETGLIVEMGKWVIEEACRQAKRWQGGARDQLPVGVSVNLSPRQLQEPTLVQDVASALAASRLDPRALTVEITETVFMERTDVVVERLDGLRALGVRIAIDDFGTGYSSLSYLARFPVDTIKIAKPFIDEIESESRDSALADAIIRMSDSLGLCTVGEGIERVGQHNRLRELGCELGQGYLFARPVPADEVFELLVGNEPPAATAKDDGARGGRLIRLRAGKNAAA
jgi:diguanylate cyclase (GGDEF)-like protein